VRSVLTILACALVLAAAVIGFAPASLVDERIAAASQGTLRAADLTGTLWRGRGTLTAPDGHWRVPLEWELQALPLLRGTLSLAFGGEGDALQPVSGRAQIGKERVIIDGLVMRVPAMIVASVSRPAVFQAAGDIEMRIDSLEITPQGFNGTVAAQWKNARVAAPGRAPVDLGSLAANLAARGQALSGPLTSSGGAVLMTGNVSVDNRRLAVNARLAPAASASQQVRESLAALGPADASGAVVVRVERSTR
jgi:hypothetical protein